MPTSNILPLEQLANDLISAVESMVERIRTSPEQPASSFASEGRSNFLYVLYSATGIPLRAGVVTGTSSKREANALQADVQKMASSGLVRSYRTLELGSERLAQQVGTWFSELFGSMLPLSGIVTTADVPWATQTSGAENGSAPKRRGRPAGSKGKRRGRPRKQAGKVDVAPAPESTISTKRRGRPSKAASAGAESAPKGRTGRPRKTAVPPEATEVPKRRGRKPKAIAASEGIVPEPKKRGGRRVKEIGTQDRTERPKRGRASKGSASSKAPAKRRGRPRRTEAPAVAE